MKRQLSNDVINKYTIHLFASGTQNRGVEIESECIPDFIPIPMSSQLNYYVSLLQVMWKPQMPGIIFNLKSLKALFRKSYLSRPEIGNVR